MTAICLRVWTWVAERPAPLYSRIVSIMSSISRWVSDTRISGTGTGARPARSTGGAGGQRGRGAAGGRRQRRPGPPEGNVLQLDPGGVAQHLGGHVEGAVNARGREGDLPRTALGVLHEFLHDLPGAVCRDPPDRGVRRDERG